MLQKKCIVFILVFAAATMAFAEQGYVKSKQAFLWAEPNFQAEKTGVLQQGQVVEIKQSQRGWSFVSHDQLQGWTMQMMLGDKPVTAVSTEEKQAREEFAKRARIRPSSYATTAAARGLREKKDEFSSGLKCDYDALTKMESMQVDDQTAIEFIKKVQLHDKTDEID
ncbi:MAG: hypothetical protein GY874_21820 [Desulfobacteraceae bacterium]|nr:hypothetical protein [Desulfobacteraceae bacterium]